MNDFGCVQMAHSPPESPDFVAQFNLFRVQEILSAEAAYRVKNVTPHQNAGP